MADEDKVVYLVAAKGFSANGVTMAEGEYLTDQFDAQTIKVLKGMGRLVETDVAPGADDEGQEELDLPGAKKRGKKEPDQVDGSGLPGLPGT